MKKLLAVLVVLGLSGCVAESDTYNDNQLEELDAIGLLHFGNSEPVDADQASNTDHDYRCECRDTKEDGCQERFGHGEGDELGEWRTRGKSYDCMNAPKCGGGKRCKHKIPDPGSSTPAD